MKERQLPAGRRQEELSQTEKMRRLKADLKRVTEERDI
jgi:transposase